MSEIWIVTLTDKNDYVHKITTIFLNYDTARGILGHVHASCHSEWNNIPEFVTEYQLTVTLFNTVVSSNDATLLLTLEMGTTPVR